MGAVSDALPFGGFTVLTRTLAEDEGSGFFAYLQDFEECNATGDTLEEALENLAMVQEEVTSFYRETGRYIPRPFPT